MIHMHRILCGCWSLSPFGEVFVSVRLHQYVALFQIFWAFHRFVEVILLTITYCALGHPAISITPQNPRISCYNYCSKQPQILTYILISTPKLNDVDRRRNHEDKKMTDGGKLNLPTLPPGNFFPSFIFAIAAIDICVFAVCAVSGL
jgi:hypothetical protein